MNICFKIHQIKSKIVQVRNKTPRIAFLGAKHAKNHLLISQVRTILSL